MRIYNEVSYDGNVFSGGVAMIRHRALDIIIADDNIIHHHHYSAISIAW